MPSARARVGVAALGTVVGVIGEAAVALHGGPPGAGGHADVGLDWLSVGRPTSLPSLDGWQHMPHSQRERHERR